MKKRERTRGRPGKAKAAAARAARTPAAKRVKTLTRDAPRITRLTQSFFELERTARRDFVESVREMGVILKEGEKLLKPDDYKAWVHEDLGVSGQSARNYLHVLEVSRTNPDLFLEWKGVGATKMMRLGKVEPEARARVLTAAYGSDLETKVTDAEFKKVTQPYLKNPRTVSDNMLAHGLRMKVQALTTDLEKARGLAGIEKEDVRLGLCADLAALARAAQALKSKLC